MRGVTKASLPLWLLLAVMILHPNTIKPVVSVGSSTASLLYLLPSTLAVIGIFFCLRALPVRRESLMLPFLPVGFAVVSGIVNGAGGELIVDGAKPLLAGGLVASYVVLLCRLEPGTPRNVLRGIAYIGVPMAALAAYQYLVGNWGFYDRNALTLAGTSNWYINDRVAATFGHPVLYGTFCALAIIAAITAKPRFATALIAANCIGLALSASRSAVFAVAAGVVAALIANRRRRGPVCQTDRDRRDYRLGLTFAGICGLVVAILFLPARFAEFIEGTLLPRFTNLSESNSFLAHNDRRDLAIEVIKSGDWGTSLFGYGPRAAREYINEYGIPIVRAGDRFAQTFDNAYLVLIIDYGAIGLLLIIALSIAALRRSLWVYFPLATVLAVGAFSYTFDETPILVVLSALILGIAASGKAPIAPPSRQESACAAPV